MNQQVQTQAQAQTHTRGEARMLERYDDRTALYELSRPMKFMDRRQADIQDAVGPLPTSESHLVVVMVDADAGVPTTTIYRAVPVEHTDGYQYGTDKRVLDGIGSVYPALYLSGYDLND